MIAEKELSDYKRDNFVNYKLKYIRLILVLP